MNEQLPIGHHTADEVAELLKFKSKRAFLQKMRELGWLITDKKGVRYGLHNTPKAEIVKAGYAYKKKYTYGFGANKEQDREYYRAIFTQQGLKAIKKLMDNKEKTEAPTVKAAPNKTEIIKKPKPNKAAADREREHCLESLKAMGIY